MIKIDLITGFLGSGKTTFLKKYAAYLMQQGLRIGILENDHGAVNVDMMLLSDLRGEDCELEMVQGGCDLDCHRRRFKTKLISMGMSGYDRVLIEPSGIFDVDEFYDSLYEEPLCRWYEIGNVYAIVDAGLETDLSKQSEALLISQLSGAGRILLSRVQEESDETVKDTIMRLEQLLLRYGCARDFKSLVVKKDWEDLTAEDWDDLTGSCGYASADAVRVSLDQDGGFQSVYFMKLQMDEEQLRIVVERTFKDRECGNIVRIKGFLWTANGWMELNATHRTIRIRSIENGQEVVILIGEHLNKERIASYWEPYLLPEEETM